MKRFTLILAACLVALPLYGADDTTRDKKSVVKSEIITANTTVEAIDHAHRTVTLKDKEGNLVLLHAGPDVQGFDNLKVGDRVTFRYSEAMALAIHKPGDSQSDPSAVRSGLMAEQVTALVTIKDVDQKNQSITFDTEDGRTVSARVDDRSLLTDLQAGDQMEVTYTDALLISVEKAA